MTRHAFISPIAIALGILVAAFPSAGEEPAQESTIGLAAGKQAPFFVVDFCHGEHKDSGGCPSVIISNHETRGIILIASAPTEGAIELAKALDGVVVDGKHVLGFLVAPKANRQELVAACEKSALKSWTAGIPRESSLTTLKRVGLTDETAVAILLLDRKAVKAAHLLKAGELNATKQKEIVAEAKKFAEEGREK
jgi:hypothetical protein